VFEFRIDGFTFLGEVIHHHMEGGVWVAGVKVEHRLNDEELTRILRDFSELSSLRQYS
jgi:hypothetical protein